MSDKTKGFAKINNDFLENMYKNKFTATHIKILLCIARYTYGYSRNDWSFSLSFFAKELDTSKSYISKELKKLEEKNIIIYTEEATHTKSRKIKININFEQWFNNTTVALGDNTTVALGDNTTVALGDNTTVALGDNSTVALGDNTTVALGDNSTVALGDNQLKKTLKENFKEKRECDFASEIKNEIKVDKVDYENIKEVFNSMTVLPKIHKITEKRRKSLKTLLAKYSLDDFKNVILLANESNFLSGASGKWQGCSFDWLINQNNFIKVLEGNYKNNQNVVSNSFGNSKIVNYQGRKWDYDYLEKKEQEFLSSTN